MIDYLTPKPNKYYHWVAASSAAWGWLSPQTKAVTTKRTVCNLLAHAETISPYPSRLSAFAGNIL